MFGTEVLIYQKNSRGGWSGFGKALVWIDPNCHEICLDWSKLFRSLSKLHPNRRCSTILPPLFLNLIFLFEQKKRPIWLFLQIAYIYPDFKTALLGTFKEGELVSAQEVEVTETMMDYSCIQVPILSDPKEGTFTREISTSDFITTAPLLRDPYESRMVEVRQSRWSLVKS